MIPSGFLPWNTRIALTQSSLLAPKPLVCRPKSDFWVILGFWVLCGFAFTIAVVFFSPRQQSAGDFWGILSVMALFFALPTLLGACWMRKHGIIADARGLTFFGFHRRRFVAWNEVEDFEFRLPNSNQTKLNQPPAYLQSGGKWRHLSQVLSHHDALLETVELEAKWAKAKSWQLGETRDDGEWPKTYEYRDTSGWKLVGLYFLIAFGLAAHIWVDFLTKGITPFLTTVTQMWSFLSFWGRVGLIGTPFLMFGSMPLIVLAQYPAILTRRRYLGQKIVARRDGLSLFKNAREISINWDEIELYQHEMLPGNFQPNLCVVEGVGKRIEFVSGIENTKALLRLIQDRAEAASTTKWLHQHGVDEDVLGGAASLYRSATVGEGPKTHHYRTRTTRVLLLFGVFVVSLFIGSALMRHSGNGRTLSATDVTINLGFFLCVSVPTLLGFSAYFRSFLQCDEDGLRQRSIWGEHFLRWDEIEKLFLNEHYYLVAGKSGKIRFGLAADCEGLIAEIEKRSGVELKRNGNAV